MVRFVMLALVLLLSGCACPAFDGLDGQTSYRSCLAQPDLPVQRSSEWVVSIDTEDEDLDVTWSSDDPSVVSATGDSEDVVLRAWEVGSAEVTSVLADGTSDRVVWEIARASSGSLIDTFNEYVADNIDVEDNHLYGDLPVQPVGDTVRLWDGESLELDLLLTAADGRQVQWAPSALTAEGSVRVDDEQAVVRLAGSDLGRVFDDAGEQLLEVAVIPIDGLGSASISLGVLHPLRDAPEADAEDTAYAYLRAVVTDGSEDPIYQPPLSWTVLGHGTVSAVGEGSSSLRTDIAYWTLEEGELGNQDDAKACVVVSLETDGGTVSRSAWITSDLVEVYDNATCGSRGCACSAVEPSSAPLSVAALVLIAGLVRRRS